MLCALVVTISLGCSSPETISINDVSIMEEKTTTLEDFGLSIDLPKGWTINYCCVQEGDSTFKIYRNKTPMMNLRLDSKMLELSINSILQKFDFEAAKDEPSQEVDCKIGSLKRTGAIGTNNNYSETGPTVYFYYQFIWDSHYKKPIIIEPENDRIENSKDTCFKIINSIKAIK